MPPVAKRQVMTPANGRATATPRGSVLDRIAPVALRDDGIKLLVYGRGKTGKTRLACTFPKPLLLIGTEDGTKSVGGVKGVDFVRVHSSAEFGELVGMLAGGKYRSAVLDTAGGLQDMILAEVLGLADAPVQKSWGLTDRATWGVVGAQFKERMRSLLDLADRTGLNVVTIAHERSFGEEGGSDLITQTVGAALTPSAAGWLNAACDYICQTFLRMGEEVKVSKIAGKETRTRVQTGKVEYCLRVGPHPVFMTGFRLPQGSGDLPDAIVDPDHGKILKLIKGG